jgi:exopolyphosphatase/guanosine-5'-triphosphate,3'-diphosphate pyrophosphatase
MSSASIDIGTNAVLLLLLRKNDGDLEEILDRSTITRLGQGLIESGRLSGEAMERTVKALEGYRHVIDDHGASVVSCFGTSALREAANRDEFIRTVRERTGLEVKVFSEYQEAYYTYLSVRSDPAVVGRNLVIVDIGGGSTEITRGDREHFDGYVSLPVGTVKLTELFIKHDPPLKEELERLTRRVRDVIGSPEAARSGMTVVGMAGTMTTLATMVLGLKEFDKGRVHGLTIPVATLDEWIERLSAMTVDERQRIPGMEVGREDLLLQGMVLMREILGAYGASEFVVSTYGARYGVVYEWAENVDATGLSVKE